MPKWKDDDTVEFIIFRFIILFLPKYCVKYYDYMYSGKVGYNIIGQYCLNLSFRGHASTAYFMLPHTHMFQIGLVITSTNEFS